jgi:hypothetical protein
MTHAEMLGRMSSKELTEWFAFNHLEPFGEVHADMRSALIAYKVGTIAHAFGGKGPPPKFSDYRTCED